MPDIDGIADRLRAQAHEAWLREAGPGFGRLTAAEFQAALYLKQLLLREFRGARLEDLYDCAVVQTNFGACLRIQRQAAFSMELPAPETARRLLLRELRLLYGIGPAVAEALRAQGFQTIADLAWHPRFRAEAHAFLQALETRNIEQLAAQMDRWLPRSHPLRLCLAPLLPEPEGLICFDIETLGLFGRPVVLLGLARPVAQGLQVEQLLVRHIEEELPALVAAFQRLRQGRVLVTYNGRAFDLNVLAERLAYYGLDASWPQALRAVHLDLLHHARRWDLPLPDRRLGTLERGLLGRERPLDLPSALVPDFYHAYLEQENIGPLVVILEHNHQDLVTLAELMQHFVQQAVSSTYAPGWVPQGAGQSARARARARDGRASWIL